MGDGEFVLGGRPIEAAGGVVRGPEGQLAGSALTMIDAVRNLHGLGIAAGRRAAARPSTVPAQVIGRPDLGRLAVGAPADIVVLDDRLEIVAGAGGGRRPCRSLGPRWPSSRPCSSGCCATAAIAAAAAAIERRRPRYAVIAARGSSDNAARYAQHLFGRFWGLPVALAAPSLHTLYDAPMRYDDALVIGISQSGASPDVASVVAAATEQGALTIAITNEPDSRLGTAARHVIDLQHRAGALGRGDEDLHGVARRGRGARSATCRGDPGARWRASSSPRRCDGRRTWERRRGDRPRGELRRPRSRPR